MICLACTMLPVASLNHAIVHDCLDYLYVNGQFHSYYRPCAHCAQHSVCGTQIDLRDKGDVRPKICWLPHCVAVATVVCVTLVVALPDDLPGVHHK